MNSKLKLINAVALTVALTGVTAQAANVTWTGAEADGLYATSNNWDTGTLPTSADSAFMTNGETIEFADGLTNVIQRGFIDSGTILNMTGGSWNHNRAGNTIRTFIGNGTTTGTINLSDGNLQIGHALWIDNGSVNVTDGELNVYRGSNSGVGGGLPNGASFSIGRLATPATGLLKISGGFVGTRGGIEIGAMGTLEVVGAGAEISLGNQSYGNGDGAYYQTSNATLRVGISTNGLTPIVLNDTGATGTPYGQLFGGSILDVSFIDGADGTVGFWPVVDVSTGQLVNAGMVFDPGVDTNDWGFITSNNTLYVGFGLGWPQGGDVVTPPSAGRTLYWTGAAGDTDADNGTNWVTDTAGTTTDWGPYNDDTWNIGNFNVVTGGQISVVDYDGTSIFGPQGGFSIGNRAQGELNWLSGTHDFATSTSSRQYIGHGTSEGNGTVNVYDGTLGFNSLSVGNDGATGAINVYGGTFTVGRASTVADYSTSIALAEGAGGTGMVHIANGRMFTRAGVSLGANGGVGVFSVEGSTITDIGIGSQSSIDGVWVQYGASVLKIRVDAGGVTPIRVVEKDAAAGGGDGNVEFRAGSTLDIDFIDGYTGGNGEWDVMHWDGQLVTGDLAFDAAVDTDRWSFSYEDTNADTTNDTLRVKASGFGPVVQPNITSYSVDGSMVSLSWDSELGINYNVLSRMDLVNGSWSTNVAAIPGADVTTSTNLTGAGSVELYQIEAYE